MAKKEVQKNCAIKIVGGFDEPEEINSVMKTPNGTPHLKDYEFYLKVRHRPIQTFKTPSDFISKRKKYEMMDEQEKEIDKMQEERYYRVIGQTVPNKRIEVQKPDKQAIPDALKPQFKLIIKEKDV